MAKDRTDYQIRQILKYNRDGSPNRQSARHQNLMRCVRQLHARGYAKTWDVRTIGKREVHRLADDWRTAGLSGRTIANRMVDLRWLAAKVGRADHIPTNREIGVGLRRNTPGWGENKARELDRAALRQLGEREQLITELRREFGLRTEEALKFQHAHATRDPDRIRLVGSWCKGGRPREIPVTTDRQRDLLERVANFQAAEPACPHGHRSMIPPEQSFLAYYRDYNEARHALGIPGHELRHAWAQERFEQVAGIPPPHAGGPKYSDLEEADRKKWQEAAGVVNRELGHGRGRGDITATYIGTRQ